MLCTINKQTISPNSNMCDGLDAVGFYKSITPSFLPRDRAAFFIPALHARMGTERNIDFNASQQNEVVFGANPSAQLESKSYFE
mmetsp:Transcript_13533/g.22298  ORF Transcript_13533/g.22298 Transcript_13533/m.22298 type:complete len:84 (-) Transcript_13533:12-263(-)